MKNIQSFSTLNKKKIPFMFGMISSIFIAFILLLLLIVWLVNGDFPGLVGMCIIILVAGIPMPAISLVIGCIGWYLERRVRIVALKKKPLNQLHEIGFIPTFIGADTDFSFTEETLGTTIRGYEVQFNVGSGFTKIEFLVFVHHPELSKEKFNVLEKKFEKENIDFALDGLIKKYKISQLSKMSIFQLENELQLLVEELKAEGFMLRERD